MEVVRLFESEESDSTKGIGSVLQPRLCVGPRGQTTLLSPEEKRGEGFSPSWRRLFRPRRFIPSRGNRSGFDEFLASKGVHYHFLRGIVLHREAEAPRWIRLCRRWNEGLEKTLLAGAEDEDETRANLLVAMLLGKKSAIPAERKKQFVVAGAMHLFAISGLHVGIVAALLVFLLLFLPGPKWVETWVLLVLLFVYVEVTGGAPSARRAFVMIAFGGVPTTWEEKAVLSRVGRRRRIYIGLGPPTALGQGLSTLLLGRGFYHSLRRPTERKVAGMVAAGRA